VAVTRASTERCKAAAYHESAHIVIACQRGLPINPKGICIDDSAWGCAYFKGAAFDIDVISTGVPEVVVALFAGGTAQSRVYNNVDVLDACISDERRIEEILVVHFPDPTMRHRMEDQLRASAGKMVDTHWEAIERVTYLSSGRSCLHRHSNDSVFS